MGSDKRTDWENDNKVINKVDLFDQTKIAH